MLDAFIIEQIRRREEEQQRNQRQQPRLESPSRMPLQRPPGWDRDADSDRRRSEDDYDGVMIIDM